MRHILALFFIVVAVNAEWKGGLRARFGVNPLQSFFKLPQTVSEAKEEGWTLRTRSQGLPYQTLTMYCPSPAIICVLYDDTEHTAGMQIAVEESNFSPVVDMEEAGFHKWTTDDGTYWASTEYLGSEEYYSTPSATRQAARNPDTLLQTQEVWVTGTHGKLYRIPRSLKEMETTAPWTKQACIPAMGLHYYYNLTSETPCNSRGLFPWFGLYDQGELIGAGWKAFGTYEQTRGGKKWFEWTSEFAVKLTLPRAPQCLYDLASDPGTLTLHTYFVNSPVAITCLDQLNNIG